MAAVLIISLIGRPANAEPEQSGTTTSDAPMRIMDAVANGHYNEALAWCDTMIATRPSAPDGYFFRATTLGSRSIDFEDDLDDSAADAASDSVIAICDRLMAAGDNSPTLLYFRGTTLGYRSYACMRNKVYLKGYLLGKEGANDLKEALKQNLRLYDACLGLGTFYYYRSQYAGLLREFGLFKDRRDEGRALIKTAADSGLYSQIPAQSALGWIAIEDGRFADASEIAQSLVLRFPNSRSFRWCLGRALRESGRWPECSAAYRELLTLIRRESRNNHFNEIGCLHSLTCCAYELGDWQNTVRTADDALALKPDNLVLRRKASDLDHIRQMRKEASRVLASRINE